MPRFTFGDWVEDVVDWLQSNLTWIFDAIKTVLGGHVRRRQRRAQRR